jgi:uncharacterized protein
MMVFIPQSSVKITSGFWADRQKTNREVTIPFQYQQLLKTGQVDAFKLAWKHGDPKPPHIFWDSDLAKWIEAASYSLATHPDPELEGLLDETIALIASAQQKDGYLNVHFTVVEPEKRWTNLRDMHELYCAGHMIEAGAAHFMATGKRSLLDVVCKYVDYIDSTFGREPGKKRGYPGHEEIELALVKLFHVTREPRYLNLSRYFINERGSQPHYFDIEAVDRGEKPVDFWAARGLPNELRYAYNQAHQPVREQEQVMGHAVRAMYLYSAMADLAFETKDSDLQRACEALWEDLCLKKMYITGGIGPSRHNEGFTMPYDLPNETAYAETCAAIGLVFWNQRMLQLDCDSKYGDVMERALYNGVLSGVSLEGDRFFYVNPLESDGSHHRQPWYECACCPPNIARLLASLGGYIYSKSFTDGDKAHKDILAVHLYIDSSVHLDINGAALILIQETRYPWDGNVRFTLDLDRPADFVLKLRMPGWCRSASLKWNGEPVECLEFDQGYINLDCGWSPGDQLELLMEMPVERVYASPAVKAAARHIAIQRGPLVYCLEQVDHALPISLLHLPDDVFLKQTYLAEFSGGMVVISAETLALDTANWGNELYRNSPPGTKPATLFAIPYFAWDNRQDGAMQVWI